MSDHTRALVPLESWCYASPELRTAGRTIDIGLFAEALIYYDSVLINLTNQPQFAEFLRWFVQQERLADLISLVRDGTIKVYDYAFVTTAIEKQGSYLIWNIQDQLQAKPNTFEQRFLYHPSVEGILPSRARHRKKIYEAFRGNVIEVKADDFGSPVENAREDYQDPRRNTLIVQAFVDELYRIKQLGRPPDIQANVATSPDGTKHKISWNIDFSNLTKAAGPELNFHLGTPLTAGAHSNRLIWSAAQLGCDLYLPRPMSMLVGDKLFESTETIAKAGNVVDQLKTTVEFPDVRGLVNSGKLDFSDVLTIRKKAQRFRDWLQNESDRDRDAIIAYHNEVATEAGLVRGARKALNIFGVIGGGATGAYVGTLLGGPAGGALGGAAGGAVGYLADVAAKLGANWRPVIFGDWLRDRIEKEVHNRGD